MKGVAKMSDLLADYIREREAAIQIKKSVRTLQRWEREQTGPPLTRIGRERFYRVESFKAWLAARERKAPRTGSKG
jgi:hypothetical protein